MPGFVTTRFAQNAADAARRAEEEAAKARKRAELQKKIDLWKGKRTEVIFQKNELEKEKQNLEAQLGRWGMQKNKYRGNSILYDVVIVNLFEGVSADKVKESFEEGIGEMDGTYASVDRLKDRTIEQIRRLDQYVLDINENIRVLVQEKNAI